MYKMSKLAIYSQLGDFTNLEEPPEPKELFQDLGSFPTFAKIHLSSTQRSTNYSEALCHSRQSYPVTLSKMTLQEQRHNMSTVPLQEKDQMKIYDAYKVIDMGDHVSPESLRLKSRTAFEGSHVNKARSKTEGFFNEPTVLNSDFQALSIAQNSNVFLYEDYKKFVYRQLNMFT
ncbi:hypothetical protein SEUBUCD646_0O01360 [Saccharomyces eubayanus]|uniref:Uncharacterized protein n=2 Tax=Saccharomyces TaxID=4930 RepID=A0ABN8VK61_SACEU|nr:hypothetical protein DI49_2376 [Saccharomyces eubayanus]KOG99043.1 hypothetical protein DI49_2376 [Saccharomyces eubayanus]CAI1713471.1 hypothetical protein SEUBUCD650_0O01370 [Saccharomyces eubayanus]CAI1747024.1 hypothetical protein SEUBUCD646_0O01360 [Saccharomyces eubayanus]